MAFLIRRFLSRKRRSSCFCASAASLARTARNRSSDSAGSSYKYASNATASPFVIKRRLNQNPHPTPPAFRQPLQRRATLFPVSHRADPRRLNARPELRPLVFRCRHQASRLEFLPRLSSASNPSHTTWAARFLSFSSEIRRASALALPNTKVSRAASAGRIFGSSAALMLSFSEYVPSWQVQ